MFAVAPSAEEATMNKLDVLVQVYACTGKEKPEVIRAALIASLGPDVVASFSKEMSDAEADALLRKGTHAVLTLEAYAKHNPAGFEEMLRDQGITKLQLRKENARVASFRYMSNDEHRVHQSATLIVDRDFFQLSGLTWWEHSFKHSPNDAQAAMNHAAAYLDGQRHHNAWADQAYTLIQTEEGSGQILSTALWAHCGFPLVQFTSHRYTAALMSTAPSLDIEIRPTWPAFLIELPTRLLYVSKDVGSPDHELAYVIVYSVEVTRPDGAREPAWFFTAYARTGGITLHCWRATLDAMRSGETLERDEWRDAFSGEMGNRDDRTLFLLKRLVLNTCIAMSDPTNVKPVGSKHSTAHGHRPPGLDPECRVFRVGKPVEVDCRTALTEYVNGERLNPQAVQFLVRGHWRRQACGAGLSERRLMWIEPYWKGPVDAPINTRPHRLGDH